MTYKISGLFGNQAIPLETPFATKVKEGASSFVREGGRLPSNQPSGALSGKLWNSIALRFGGFTANLSSLISPLAGCPRPDVIAPIYFREKIAEVAGLAALNPKAAVRIARAETANLARPWSDLVRIACGDDAALISVLDSPGILDGVSRGKFAGCAIDVANCRPPEGRLLLKHLFAHADTTERLQIVKAFAENPRLDPKQNLGELFVQLMARSTPEERHSEIYPGLMSIVLDPDTQVQAGKSFLRALFRGWLSEDESARDYLKQIG